MQDTEIYFDIQSLVCALTLQLMSTVPLTKFHNFVTI